MTSFSYAIIANCQARPINVAVESLTMGAGRSVGTVITHLAKNAEAEAHMEMLAKADLIFAQSVQQAYPISHVVLDNLRREFGDKVVSWPNLFFTGQSPGLCYVTVTDGRRVSGPLHEYQYRSIVESWQQGVTVDECLKKIEEGYDPETLRTSVSRSFSELKSRETGLDVIASDLIESEWQRSRLFFTFNHPSANLLLGLTERLLRKGGVRSVSKITPELLGEPLSKIIPPVSGADAETLGLGYSTTNACKGIEVTISGGQVTHGNSKIYSIRELVETTYRALNAQRDSMSDIRYTPA